MTEEKQPELWNLWVWTPICLCCRPAQRIIIDRHALLARRAGFFRRDNAVPGTQQYERRIAWRIAQSSMNARRGQNRGTTWESGLTHLSAQVTGNLGGHGLSWRAVISIPHAIAGFCSASCKWRWRSFT